MSLDLSRLTPAPWEPVMTGHAGCVGINAGHVTISHMGGTDGEFVALARNAFDVMMRRNLRPSFIVYTVFADMPMTHSQRTALAQYIVSLGDIDAFTAIVEADKWYIGNVENKSSVT